MTSKVIRLLLSLITTLIIMRTRAQAEAPQPIPMFAFRESDLETIKDRLRQAAAAKGCMKVNLDNPERQGPNVDHVARAWTESWKFEGCNLKFQGIIDFKQDARGGVQISIQGLNMTSY